MIQNLYLLYNYFYLPNILIIYSYVSLVSDIYDVTKLVDVNVTLDFNAQCTKQKFQFIITAFILLDTHSFVIKIFKNLLYIKVKINCYV